ncbi:MAG TPA: PQQ-binding-like beta-propeller repeat protein [Streptosporangiaceae bacterium]
MSHRWSGWLRTAAVADGIAYFGSNDSKVYALKR